MVSIIFRNLLKDLHDVGEEIERGIKGYTNAVKAESFPTLAHSFTMKEEELIANLWGRKIMKVVHTIAELKELVIAVKVASKTIGFVPTMGYLHEGHLTLANTARHENDVGRDEYFCQPNTIWTK